MVFRIFLFFCILASTGLIAQSGSVTGKVVGSDGSPLPYLSVSIEGTTRGTDTDEAGVYLISNVTAGEHYVVYSRVGLPPVRREVEVISGRTTTVPTQTITTQGLDLEEVLVRGDRDHYTVQSTSASLRQRTEIAKLPQNIQVVSSELLRDQQVTSIMDGLIRNVSGATMLEHWGNFARINMRGFRLPALRNGFNVSDSWGPLSEDMSLVERVEFVKGPSGFMLSAGEPGGFYNVVTKKPTAGPIGEATLQVGSFDFYRAGVDVGGKIDDAGKLLYRLNGMFQSADTHRGNETGSRLAIAPALTYRIGEKTSVTAELTHQRAESYLGSAYVFAPVSEGYGSLDRNFKFTDPDYPAADINETMGLLNVSHQFNENWSVTLQGARLDYRQEGYSAWIAGIEESGEALRSVSIWDSESVGNYGQAFVNGWVKTGTVTHTILGGIDYTDKAYYADFFSTTAEEEPFDIFNPVYGTFPTLNFDRSEDLRDRTDGPWNGFSSVALYAQDEIGFFDDRLRVTLAGRFTQLETIGKEEQDRRFTPRLGLSFDVTPTLVVYGLYDQAFLAQGGTDAAGNTFDPVNASDVEGGLKKSFFGGRVRATLGAYHITKTNVLTGDPENPMFSIQLGEVASKGVEFDVQGQVFPGMNVVLNYANTGVEITEDTDPDLIGTRVAGHARHVTNGWLNYAFGGQSKLAGFGASLGYQYQVDRSTWSWGADNQTELPNYFRVDGGLFWSNEKLRVQVNVNNLLNDYLYSGANFGSYLYWQSEPGTNARLAVTYSFR